MRNTFIFSVIAIVIFSSFDNRKLSKEEYFKNDTPVVKLEDHKWYLSTIYRANGYTELMTRNAFIYFNTAERKIGGNGSCNSFGGKLTMDGNALSLAHIFSTKIYCDEVQSVEDEFVKQLRKVSRYEIKGNKLFLFEGDNVVLEFVE